MITKIDQKQNSRFPDDARIDPADYRRHEEISDPVLKRDGYYQNYCRNGRALYQNDLISQDISMNDPRRIQKT